MENKSTKMVHTVHRDGLRSPEAVAEPALDTRQRITMWDLLVWSYAKEKVWFSQPFGLVSERGGSHSNADSVRRCLSLGAIIRGHAASSRSACHDDADYVHSFVTNLATADFWLLVNAAEAEAPPDWNPEIELGRMEPVLTPGDKIKMLYRSHRPIACLGKFVGITPEQRRLLLDRARERYARWWHLLWMLRETMRAEDDLMRWQIQGVGAEREPWTQNIHEHVDAAKES